MQKRIRFSFFVLVFQNENGKDTEQPVGLCFRCSGEIQMFMVSFHNIMPTILLLDFGANNVSFSHIPVVKIVEALKLNA